jgi:hypothetical protein
MTIAYYRGKRIAKTPTTKTKTKKTDYVFNEAEIAHQQHLNKIAQNKIDNAYFETIEKLNKVQGLIIEGAMRKHLKDEGY